LAIYLCIEYRRVRCPPPPGLRPSTGALRPSTRDLHSSARDLHASTQRRSPRGASRAGRPPAARPI
jgi:hypothetical protein